MSIIDNLYASCTKTIELCTILTSEDVKLSAFTYYNRSSLIKPLNDRYRLLFRHLISQL